MTVDVSSAGALRRRMELQGRLWRATHTIVHRTGRRASANQLYREIQSYLIKASDQRLIREPPKVIRNYLLHAGPDANGVVDIAVGTVRNFNRTKDLPHFTRRDGGWFDFQLQVREEGDRTEIIAYDFELRLPTNSDLSFGRFDLNPLGRGQDDDGLRRIGRIRRKPVTEG